MKRDAVWCSGETLTTSWYPLRYSHIFYTYEKLERSSGKNFNPQYPLGLNFTHIVFIKGKKENLFLMVEKKENFPSNFSHWNFCFEPSVNGNLKRGSFSCRLQEFSPNEKLNEKIHFSPLKWRRNKVYTRFLGNLSTQRLTGRNKSWRNNS